MYNTDEYIELIKGRLSPYRFNHSMCVADRAVELAKRNNLDPQKAYVAGILHDIMKEESLDSQQKIIESTGYTMTAVELASPNVYHQMSGAVYVRDILGIDDEDIVGGIRYHTTGRADMTPFEMLIYLADFTSADRDYPDVEDLEDLPNGCEYGVILLAKIELYMKLAVAMADQYDIGADNNNYLKRSQRFSHYMKLAEEARLEYEDYADDEASSGGVQTYDLLLASRH